MKPSVRLAVVAAALTVGAVAARQSAPAFRVERPVTAVSGPQRLAIDVPLLTGGAPFTISGSRARPLAVGGLSDLRFFDAGGVEVPYLLVYAPSSQPPWERGRVLPVAATEKTSGFEADFGEAFAMDAIRIDGLRPPFLKRLVVEGSGDRQHWTMLAPEGTLFHLPDEDLRQTQVPFAPGAFRYLRVTWDDTNSGRVPLPTLVEARRRVEASPPPALTAAIVVERRPSEPGRSRYRLRLPAARLPIVALELQADAGHVFRDARVYQPRLVEHEAEPSQVGAARLRRVLRDGIAAGTLRIPLSGVTEPELDLVIEDGPNPPLAIVGATVAFAELPWIYFEAPAGTLTARYGDATLPTPSYDLEAVRERVIVAQLPDARWGEPRAHAVEAAAGVGPPLPQRGASIDASGFRYLRPLPPGGAELVVLTLDAAALAHSRGPSSRFADLRIIDPEGRQVPYLLERRDEPTAIELAVAPAPDDAALRAATGPSWSAYAIELPYEHLPPARLIVETSARVFRRTVRLLAERPPDRRRRDRRFEVLASAGWTHTRQDDAAPALTLPLPAHGSRRVVLSIDEGDNQPLPVTAVRLLLPSYRVRFQQPAGTPLRLAYGRDDLAPPRYDLALLATHVLGLSAREIAAAPEAEPPGRTSASVISPRMFWLLLGASVIVLLAIIGRLILKS